MKNNAIGFVLWNQNPATRPLESLEAIAQDLYFKTLDVRQQCISMSVPIKLMKLIRNRPAH